MKILLESRNSIIDWAAFFTIGGYRLCVPVWKILDFPLEVCEKPQYLLETAKFFFVHDRSLSPDSPLASETEVENFLEARRMVDLGHLYECFGRLVAYYGENVAEQLYQLGMLHFAGRSARLWDYWDVLFSRLRTDRTWVTEALGNRFGSELVTIVNRRFKELADKQETLAAEWKRICDLYSSDQEKLRDDLNEVSWCDVRSADLYENDRGETCGELSRVFDFDSFIENHCSIKIWKDLNVCFENQIRHQFFQLSIGRFATTDFRVSEEIGRIKESYLNL